MICHSDNYDAGSRASTALASSRVEAHFGVFRARWVRTKPIDERQCAGFWEVQDVASPREEHDARVVLGASATKRVGHRHGGQCPVTIRQPTASCPRARPSVVSQDAPRTT